MTELQLQWLSHPDDPLAPRALTEDIRQVVTRELLGHLLSENSGDSVLTDEQYVEMLEELQDDPSFLSMVEAESIRRAAKVRDVATHSVEAQAVQAAQSGFHGYHPQQFASVEAMLEDALQGTTYGSTEYYNLRWIVKVLVPHCLRNHIPVPPDLWGEEVKSKARYLADHLGPRYAEHGVTVKSPEGELPDELSAATERMLSAVVDRSISLARLKEEFPATPASHLSPLEVYHYVEPEGGYLVIPYRHDAQRRVIERQLGKKATWHLGDGTEQFLLTLRREQGRGSGQAGL